MKISLNDVKSILLNSNSKKIISKLKNFTLKPNNMLNMMLNQDFIPFVLIIENGSVELIAQTYQIFLCFTHAIEEIIKNKKNISHLIKNI